jgi:hypothetical protein
MTEIIAEKDQKKDVDFKFDDSEKQTFEKLKNLAVLDQERIIESEGLPFAYVINLMSEVKDILTLHSSTLVNQVEKVLNE